MGSYPFHKPKDKNSQLRGLRTIRSCFKKTFLENRFLISRTHKKYGLSLHVCFIFGLIYFLSLTATELIPGGICRFQTNRCFIKRWEESFSDPKILRSSFLGVGLSNLVEEIIKFQNPRDCQNANYLVVDFGSSDTFDLQLLQMMYMLYLSLLKKRILIFSHNLPFLWTKGCPDFQFDGRIDCVFQKLSSCQDDVLRALEEGKSHFSIYKIEKSINAGENHSFFDFSEIPDTESKQGTIVRIKNGESLQIFEHARNLFFDSSTYVSFAKRLIYQKWSEGFGRRYFSRMDEARRLIKAALVTYITRLNKESVRIISEDMKEFFKTSGLTCRDLKGIIGVPMIGTTTCKNIELLDDKEVCFYNTTNYVEVTRRLAIGIPSVKHILFSTEDVTALKRAQEASLESWYPLNTMSLSLKVNIYHDDWIGEWRNMGKSTILLQILSALHIQAQMHYHVISPDSKLSSLIHIFAQAAPGKKHYFMCPIGNPKNMKMSEHETFM